MNIKQIFSIVISLFIIYILAAFTASKCITSSSDGLNDIINKKFDILRLKQIKENSSEYTLSELSTLNDVAKKENDLKKSNEIYILVSRTEGKLYVKYKNKIIDEFIASLGSGKTLVYKNRKWVFNTPVRMFQVIKKKTRPIWIKPDWAFIENKEHIPPLHSPLRIDRTGYLGKYGIYLGDEYLIHGFSSERENLAGLYVTHGCIGLKAKDLKKVYDLVNVGTYVLVK